MAAFMFRMQFERKKVRNIFLLLLPTTATELLSRSMLQKTLMASLKKSGK
jgi:hypothetical protein